MSTIITYYVAIIYLLNTASEPDSKSRASSGIYLDSNRTLRVGRHLLSTLIALFSTMLWLYISPQSSSLEAESGSVLPNLREYTETF